MVVIVILESIKCHLYIFIYIYAEPILHVICTSVGCYIGYQVHMYEERAEERTEMLLKKYRHAPKLWAAQLTKEYRAYDDYNAEDEDEYEDEEEV